MSSSKSSLGFGGSAGAGQKTFQGTNLNGALKPASASSKDGRSAVLSQRGSMAIMVGKRGITKSVGAAAAPAPINTPSLKSENKGRDVSVNIVGNAGSAGWVQGGQGSGSSKLTDSPPQRSLNPSSNSVLSKPAPWAKPVSSASSAPEGSSSPVLKPVSMAPKSWAADEDSDDDDAGNTSSPKRQSWPDNFREERLDDDRAPERDSGGQWGHSNDSNRFQPRNNNNNFAGGKRDFAGGGDREYREHRHFEDRNRDNFRDNGNNRDRPAFSDRLSDRGGFHNDRSNNDGGGFQQRRFDNNRGGGGDRDRGDRDRDTFNPNFRSNNFSNINNNNSDQQYRQQQRSRTMSSGDNNYAHNANRRDDDKPNAGGGAEMEEARRIEAARNELMMLEARKKALHEQQLQEKQAAAAATTLPPPVSDSRNRGGRFSDDHHNDRRDHRDRDDRERHGSFDVEPPRQHQVWDRADKEQHHERDNTRDQRSKPSGPPTHEGPPGMRTEERNTWERAKLPPPPPSAPVTSSAPSLEPNRSAQGPPAMGMMARINQNMQQHRQQQEEEGHHQQPIKVLKHEQQPQPQPKFADPSKTYASLFPRNTTVSQDHDEDDEKVAGEDEGHGESRERRVSTKKRGGGLLFDPTSSRLVESSLGNEAGGGSHHHAAAAHTNKKTDSKWSRAGGPPGAFSNRRDSRNDEEEDQASTAEPAGPTPEEIERQQRREKRIKESETRGPRTKGRLYFFTENDEIEQVIVRKPVATSIVDQKDGNAILPAIAMAVSSASTSAAAAAAAAAEREEKERQRQAQEAAEAKAQALLEQQEAQTKAQAQQQQQQAKAENQTFDHNNAHGTGGSVGSDSVHSLASSQQPQHYQSQQGQGAYMPATSGMNTMPHLSPMSPPMVPAAATIYPQMTASMSVPYILGISYEQFQQQLTQPQQMQFAAMDSTQQQQVLLAMLKQQQLQQQQQQQAQAAAALQLQEMYSSYRIHGVGAVASGITSPPSVPVSAAISWQDSRLMGGWATSAVGADDPTTLALLQQQQQQQQQQLYGAASAGYGGYVNAPTGTTVDARGGTWAAYGNRYGNPADSNAAMMSAYYQQNPSVYGQSQADSQQQQQQQLSYITQQQSQQSQQHFSAFSGIPASFQHQQVDKLQREAMLAREQQQLLQQQTLAEQQLQQAALLVQQQQQQQQQAASLMSPPEERQSQQLLGGPPRPNLNAGPAVSSDGSASIFRQELRKIVPETTTSNVIDVAPALPTTTAEAPQGTAPTAGGASTQDVRYSGNNNVRPPRGDRDTRRDDTRRDSDHHRKEDYSSRRDDNRRGPSSEDRDTRGADAPRTSYGGRGSGSGRGPPRSGPPAVANEFTASRSYGGGRGRGSSGGNTPTAGESNSKDLPSTTSAGRGAGRGRGSSEGRAGGGRGREFRPRNKRSDSGRGGESSAAEGAAAT